MLDGSDNTNLLAILDGDAQALRKVARFMRRVAAERPTGSTVAGDLELYSTMLLLTAGELLEGPGRLPPGS